MKVLKNWGMSYAHFFLPALLKMKWKTFLNYAPKVKEHAFNARPQ